MLLSGAAMMLDTILAILNKLVCLNERWHGGTGLSRRGCAAVDQGGQASTEEFVVAVRASLALS